MDISGLTGFVGGIIRAMGPAIIAWLVARHVTPEIASNLVQYLADAAVAVIMLISAGFSVRKNLQHNKVADMISRPEITRIEMTPELADSVASAAPKYANKIVVPQSDPVIQPTPKTSWAP